MSAHRLVLCYHAVSPRWAHALAVSPASFESQVRSLLRRGLRPRVTFDDAFCNIRAVLPLLERLGLPATVFACTAYADTGAPLGVPELVDEVRSQPEDLATMTWEDLRSLADSGVEIGSHTVTHPHLTSLTDEELWEELRGSRERLEDELGRPCRTLAYPYGEHDARVRAAVRDAGYATAYALPAVAAEPYDDYCLPRVGVYGRDGIVRVHAKCTPAVRYAAGRLLAARREYAELRPGDPGQ